MNIIEQAEKMVEGLEELDQNDIAAFTRHVLSSRWWTQRTNSQPEISLERGSGLEVLHLLAHEMSGDNVHGVTFCRDYLYLVERFMGVETMKKLRDAFVELEIPYRRKKRC